MLIIEIFASSIPPDNDDYSVANDETQRFFTIDGVARLTRRSILTIGLVASCLGATFYAASSLSRVDWRNQRARRAVFSGKTLTDVRFRFGKISVADTRHREIKSQLREGRELLIVPANLLLILAETCSFSVFFFA